MNNVEIIDLNGGMEISHIFINVSGALRKATKKEPAGKNAGSGEVFLLFLHNEWIFPAQFIFFPGL